ncbi:MAG: hypothetical protein VX745_10145, partial [Pseudomonadota bacterium]|nr:hypothetical protein [Pseudomonadota bacterium]
RQSRRTDPSRQPATTPLPYYDFCASQESYDPVARLLDLEGRLTRALENRECDEKLWLRNVCGTSLV